MDKFSVLLLLIALIQFCIGSFGHHTSQPVGGAPSTSYVPQSGIPAVPQHGVVYNYEAQPVGGAPSTSNVPQSGIPAVPQHGVVYNYEAAGQVKDDREQAQEFLNYYLWAHRLFNALSRTIKNKGKRQAVGSMVADPEFNKHFDEAHDNYMKAKEALKSAKLSKGPTKNSEETKELIRNFIDAHKLYENYKFAVKTGLYGLLGDPPLPDDKADFFRKYCEARIMRKKNEEALRSGRHGVPLDPELSGEKLAFFQNYLVAREVWKRHKAAMIYARNGPQPNQRPPEMPEHAYDSLFEPPQIEEPFNFYSDGTSQPPVMNNGYDVYLDPRDGNYYYPQPPVMNNGYDVYLDPRDENYYYPQPPVMNNGYDVYLDPRDGNYYYPQPPVMNNGYDVYLDPRDENYYYPQPPVLNNGYDVYSDPTDGNSYGPYYW